MGMVVYMVVKSRYKGRYQRDKFTNLELDKENQCLG